MKKFKKTIAVMTAGLLCMAGTPTLPAEIQRTISLIANAEEDENALYLKDGDKISVVLTPGGVSYSYPLIFQCQQSNETSYVYYRDGLKEYVKINHTYDESLIQVDEETGDITAIKGTDGGTTKFTVEDTQGNTQEFTVKVVGKDPEIVSINFTKVTSFSGTDSTTISLLEGESCYLKFNYYTGAPDYRYVENGYSPDVFGIIGDYVRNGNILTFKNMTFDKETGEIRVNDSGDPEYPNTSFSIVSGINDINDYRYNFQVTVRAYFTEQQTTAETTTTTMMTTTATTSTTPETTMTTTPMTTTSAAPMTTTSMTTTAIETTTLATTEEPVDTTVPATTEEPVATTETTTQATTTLMTTTATETTTQATTTLMTTTATETTTQATTTLMTTTAIETTTLAITEETTAQATTEEPIEETTVQETIEEPVATTETTTEEPVETTVTETTEEPIATTETTPEATEEPATDDPNNGEDLPETGTTGMPPARIAEYFALMLTIAGAGMITRSRKKEN